MERELTFKTERLFYALLVAQIVPLDSALNAIQALLLNLTQWFVSVALLDALHAILQILKNVLTATMALFY